MKLGRLVRDDRDGIIGHVQRAVADPTVAAEIVDSIEELHAGYALPRRSARRSAWSGRSRCWSGLAGAAASAGNDPPQPAPCTPPTERAAYGVSAIIAPPVHDIVRDYTGQPACRVLGELRGNVPGVEFRARSTSAVGARHRSALTIAYEYIW